MRFFTLFSLICQCDAPLQTWMLVQIGILTAGALTRIWSALMVCRGVIAPTNLFVYLSPVFSLIAIENIF